MVNITVDGEEYTLDEIQKLVHIQGKSGLVFDVLIDKIKEMDAIMEANSSFGNSI